MSINHTIAQSYEKMWEHNRLFVKCLFVPEFIIIAIPRVTKISVWHSVNYSSGDVQHRQKHSHRNKVTVVCWRQLWFHSGHSDVDRPARRPAIIHVPMLRSLQFHSSTKWEAAAQRKQWNMPKKKQLAELVNVVGFLRGPVCCRNAAQRRLKGRADKRACGSVGWGVNCELEMIWDQVQRTTIDTSIFPILVHTSGRNLSVTKVPTNDGSQNQLKISVAVLCRDCWW